MHTLPILADVIAAPVYAIGAGAIVLIAALAAAAVAVTVAIIRRRKT